MLSGLSGAAERGAVLAIKIIADELDTSGVKSKPG
jgi:hypothetical protein